MLSDSRSQLNRNGPDILTRLSCLNESFAELMNTTFETCPNPHGIATKHKCDRGENANHSGEILR